MTGSVCKARQRTNQLTRVEWGNLTMENSCKTTIICLGQNMERLAMLVRSKVIKMLIPHITTQIYLRIRDIRKLKLTVVSATNNNNQETVAPYSKTDQVRCSPMQTSLWTQRLSRLKFKSRTTLLHLNHTTSHTEINIIHHLAHMGIRIQGQVRVKTMVEA